MRTTSQNSRFPGYIGALSHMTISRPLGVRGPAQIGRFMSIPLAVSTQNRFLRRSPARTPGSRFSPAAVEKGPDFALDHWTTLGPPELQSAVQAKTPYFYGQNRPLDHWTTLYLSIDKILILYWYYFYFCNASVCCETPAKSGGPCGPVVQNGPVRPDSTRPSRKVVPGYSEKPTERGINHETKNLFRGIAEHATDS